MRLYFRLISIFVLFLLSTHIFAQTDPDKPNILLIIADDLGVDASNGYMQNAQMPTTPTLDSLRNAGLMFTQAWAAPKCTPTRANIMSGKYGAKTGVTGTPGNLGIEHTSLFKELDTRTNDAYACVLIGKWHLSSPVDFDHPAQHGIDYYEGSFTAMVDDYYNWSKVKNGVEENISEYVTTHLTNSAIDWVNQQNQPWFLWLAHVTPHSPFHEPPDSMYTRANVNNNLQRYMAMIESMDFEIGRLLENIPQDVLENTIIIYLGDNGTPNGPLQAYPTQHGKNSLYQGGIHIPMTITGKGVSRVGEQEDALVHAVDLYATILELAGTDLEGGIHNSLSMKPMLSGTNFPQKPYAYSELDADWTIRNDRYKLINLNNGTQEFYDLQEDPLENENLISTLSQEQSNILTELETEANVIRSSWSCQDNILNGNESAVDVCESVTCENDNSTSYTNIGCCASPEIPSVYEEEVINSVRQINTNNFPPHNYCFNSNNPDQIPQPINYEFEVPATPSIAGSPTSILNNNNRPNQYYGVALSGVLMAPAPATPFIFENPNTGEFNWDWVFEPTNNQGDGRDKVGLDCASGHTGGQGYHYHGNMFAYVETLFPAISTTTNPPLSPLQVGWASDGYPVLYRFGPDQNGDMKLLQPGYQLKSGDRPGDGITAPCGPYNGKYTNDYEYIPGLGDLDECNGIARNITLITPSGSEQFDYFYVVTDSFPQIGRCLVGTPDISFDNSNRGTPVSLLPTEEDKFHLSVSPNPVEDKLTISFLPSSAMIYRIEIMDMQGRILQREKALVQQTHQQWETSIDMTAYPVGTYLVKVSSGNISQTQTLIRR